jgi:hypothetical protein
MAKLDSVNVELALDEELDYLLVETICERKSEVTRIFGRRRMENELLHRAVVVVGGLEDDNVACRSRAGRSPPPWTEGKRQRRRRNS